MRSRLSQCYIDWIVLITSLMIGASQSLFAGDWPMHRHDVGRTSVTDDELTFPLHLAWRYVANQSPQPAWSEPPRLFNKMDFDYAPHPVVADGLLYLASNADDTVRAMDVQTGQLRWQFTAHGPIRFAPQIDSGRAYFGADNGAVYCLDAQTGKAVWKFVAAPQDEWCIGNRRMISRWPIRTGVLVEDGVVYAVAGMWPSEGIYVYALGAEQGDVIWLNDTSGMVGNSASGKWSLTDPHMGEFSFTGATPQGALLTSRDMLIVPLANNSPACFAKKGGGLKRFAGQGSGSTWVARDGDFYFTYSASRNGLQVFGVPVADKGIRKPARMFTTEEVPQISRAPIRKLGVRHTSGKVSALVHGEKLYALESFGLALAAGTLIAGERDAVVAMEAVSRRELWRAAVTGEAREIAIAEGRIFVSTTSGELSCFVPQQDNARPATIDKTTRDVGQSETVAPHSAEANVIRQLKDASVDQGFALVVGDTDGKLSTHLARMTSLRVISVVADRPLVNRLREKFLDETNLYGSRIHVLPHNRSGRLPFAAHFANAVIVADSKSEISVAELYRVLRPCGGVMVFPGMTTSQAESLVSKLDASRDEFEVQRSTQSLFIRRGQLLKARDWNRNTSGDRLVRWPLRPLWFGGPDSSLVMNVGIGAHPPVAANGRYFVTGQNSLSAIDAYNGTVLWTRAIPSATPEIRRINDKYYKLEGPKTTTTVMQWSTLKRWLSADADHVYLRLGSSFFADKDEALIQINARNGVQTALAGPVVTGPDVLLSDALSWPLEIDEDCSGQISMRREKQGLALTLTTKDLLVTDADLWSLGFDFRPRARRYGLHGEQTVTLRLSPMSGQALVSVGRGDRPDWKPRVDVMKHSTKTEFNLLLPWGQIERLAGRRPASFGFSATLTAYDKPQAMQTKIRGELIDKEAAIVQERYLFGDGNAGALTTGWATILIEGDAVETTDNPPPVVVGSFAERPERWPLPEISGDVYIGDPGSVADSVRQTPRRHPLTGEQGLRIYRSGTGGCGYPVYSEACAIGRTNKLALGFYDFDDDSGLHFFPGIASNCGARIKAINVTAALGMLIFSESRSHCSCMIPFRTSMAFSPAERRLNEDWAVFFEHSPNAPIRQAALNFGSFGDRRDNSGQLWLRVPRYARGKAYPVEPGTRRWIFDAPPMKSSLDVPLEIKPLKPGVSGMYRVNSDRVQIVGTDRPWIYASGYRAIAEAVLTLLPAKPLVARTVAGPIEVDGQLEEAAWSGEPNVTLPFTKTRVYLGRDDEHLYLAASRSPTVDRRPSRHSCTLGCERSATRQ